MLPHISIPTHMLLHTIKASETRIQCVVLKDVGISSAKNHRNKMAHVYALTLGMMACNNNIMCNYSLIILLWGYTCYYFYMQSFPSCLEAYIIQLDPILFGICQDYVLPLSK